MSHSDRGLAKAPASRVNCIAPSAGAMPTSQSMPVGSRSPGPRVLGGLPSVAYSASLLSVVPAKAGTWVCGWGHFGYGQWSTGARSPSVLGSGLRRNEVRRPRQGLGARPPQAVKLLSTNYPTFTIPDHWLSGRIGQCGCSITSRQSTREAARVRTLAARFAKGLNYAYSNASSGLDGFQLQNDQVRRRPTAEERTCDRVLFSRPPGPVSFVECHRVTLFTPDDFRYVSEEDLDCRT